MITPNYLDKKWENVTFQEGGFIRLENEHPLEWYVGYLSINQKTLMIVTNYEISSLPSTKSVIVTSRRREIDKKWTLTFELMRIEQEGVFVNLCSDIFNYSQAASNEIEALTLVIKRYKQWSRLLEYQKSALLDESSKKGLLGELLFLKSKLQEGYETSSTVQAWVGPDGADQDFAFSDAWYEIKSVGVAADSVSISSLQQLDSPGSGFLVIIRIDKCAPEHQNSMSLFQIVAEIREILQTNYDAASLFEIKLARYGYIDLPDYESDKYYCSGKKAYWINENFPKLSNKNVPTQVIASKYILSIVGITDWEI